MSLSNFAKQFTIYAGVAAATLSGTFQAEARDNYNRTVGFGALAGGIVGGLKAIAAQPQGRCPKVAKKYPSGKVRQTSDCSARGSQSYQAPQYDQAPQYYQAPRTARPIRQPKLPSIRINGVRIPNLF